MDLLKAAMNPTLLFLSLITGGIGFVLFVYGKKQQRWPQVVAGLLFMIYPYFVESAVGIVAVGVALGGLLWAVIRRGD
jgi:hypothetical protein